MRLLVAVVCLFSLGCLAQNSVEMARAVPDAPSESARKMDSPVPIALPLIKPVAEARIKPEETHRFFDRTNLMLTGVHLLAQVADGITTQRGLQRNGAMQWVTVNGVSREVVVKNVEQNPLARPLVDRGWGGQAAYAGGVITADLLLRHMLHDRGHHRLERAIPLFFAASSATGAALNSRYW